MKTYQTLFGALLIALNGMLTLGAQSFYAQCGASVATVNGASSGSLSIDGINGAKDFTVEIVDDCGVAGFHFDFVATGCAPLSIICTKTSVNESELCSLDTEPNDVYTLGGNFPVGVSTVNCKVTDCTATTAEANFTITVKDVNPPVVSVPNDHTQTTDPGQCYATVVYSDEITVADNCPGVYCQTCTGPSVDCNPPDGTQFPVGTTTVTCTGVDGSNNNTVRTFEVIVRDEEPPLMIGCEDQTVVPTTVASSNGCFGACTITIASGFNGTAIPAGRFIWFNSVMKVQGMGPGGATISFRNATITFTANNTSYNLPVPDAVITFDPNASTATTTFDGTKWVTVTPTGLGGNTFVAGLSFQVPTNFPGGISPVTWSAQVTANAGVCVNYQWGAAVYTSFSLNHNALGVKPVDHNSASQYKNSDHAGTPENFKSFVVGGARGGGGSNFTGSYSATKNCCPRSIPCNCNGAVAFNEPTATDNCDPNVTVTCTDRDTGMQVQSGDSLAPGCYRLDCTATDSSGNGGETPAGTPCSFLLCVLSPLQVVFDEPQSDNQSDNFTVDCADLNAAPIISQFSVGQSITHKVRLIDCNGNDVTTSIKDSVRVFIDTHELQGSYQTMGSVPVVPGTAVGDSGGQMTFVSGKFQYNLNTTGYEKGTINNNKFFRSCVRVEDNTFFPGTVLGQEDALLESKP